MIPPEAVKKRHVVREDTLVEFIKSFHRDQYRGDHFEEYRQLPRAKRALLVDDFSRIQLTPEERRSFLRLSANLFDIIAISSSEDELMSELLYGEGEVSELMGYKSCEIQPMGNAVRSILIKKWCSLGRDSGFNADDSAQFIEDAEKQINGIVSKSIVPSYPLFVLMLLQARETQFQGGISNCTYGPLYQHLIVTSLKAISEKPAFLDISLTLLAMVASRMFGLSRSHLSQEEFNAVIEAYDTKYGITIDRESIIKGLIAHLVLKKSGTDISFCYSYYYYYFVASFIKDHMSKEEMKTKAEFLADNCHNETNTNILLFLSSLSKDESVTDAILSAADRILPGKKFYDVTAILGLSEEEMTPSARLAIVPGTTTSNRERYQENLDESQEEVPANRPHQEPKSDGAEKEFIDLTRGGKIIQIIGQILCTSPGSLNAETKYYLVRSGYDLGLRSMSFFHDLIKERHQDIKERIVPYLQTGHPDKSVSDLRKMANGIISNIVQSVIFGLIKHVPGCIGHEALTKTYNQIMDLHGGPSERVIDLSIKIDHTRPFPAKETIALYEEMDRHRNTRDLIRNLAWQKFHLFNVPSKIMQAVCSKLEIEYKASLFLNNDEKQAPRS